MLERSAVVGAELLEWAAEHFGAGQQQLAHCTKQLVSMQPSRIVGLLDYSDDPIFLEPSLFAFFRHKRANVSLEQILFGYLPDASPLPSFSAYADYRGLVYLPRLGHLATDGRESLVTVDSESFRRRLNAIRMISGTQIELCQTSDPLLEPFFSG